MHTFNILLFALLLIPFQSAFAAEGSLYMLPERGTYTIGETFTISILADSGGEPITAAEAELTFNSASLEVLDISTKDSIMETWPTPPSYSNTGGSIRFAGWTKEKYDGNAGLLVSVTFKALRNSSSNMQLAAGAILAADGVGSNIITSMKSGLYTIEPKKIISENEPAIAPEPGGTSENTLVDDGVDGEAAASLPSEIPSSFPRFVSFDDEISTGEKVVVQGVALANSEVVVFFGRDSEKDKEVSLVSAGDGSFTFVSDELEREGKYHLKAAVMGAGNNLGPFSETISMRVISPGVAAAFASLAGIAWTVIPLITLLALVGIGIGYVVYRHRSLA